MWRRAPGRRSGTTAESTHRYVPSARSRRTRRRCPSPPSTSAPARSTDAVGVVVGVDQVGVQPADHFLRGEPQHRPHRRGRPDQVPGLVVLLDQVAHRLRQQPVLGLRRRPLRGLGPLGDVPPRARQGVADLDCADVEVPIPGQEAVGLDVAVEQQRCAGLHDGHEHLEQGHARTRRDQAQQRGPHQVLARHPVVGTRRVVGIEVGEVDDHAVVVADRRQQHVRIEHRAQRRPGPLARDDRGLALGADVGERRHHGAQARLAAGQRLGVDQDPGPRAVGLVDAHHDVAHRLAGGQRDHRRMRLPRER